MIPENNNRILSNRNKYFENAKTKKPSLNSLQYNNNYHKLYSMPNNKKLFTNDNQKIIATSDTIKIDNNKIVFNPKEKRNLVSDEKLIYDLKSENLKLKNVSLHLSRLLFKKIKKYLLQ